jgi:hypothetical protein
MPFTVIRTYRNGKVWMETDLTEEAALTSVQACMKDKRVASTVVTNEQKQAQNPLGLRT